MPGSSAAGSAMPGSSAAGSSTAGSAMPGLGSPGRPADDPPAAIPDPRRERARLRDLNATLAQELARATGLPHARVDAELNRLAGIGRVTEATQAQLTRRIDEGRRWLDRLRRRG
jgi:hypothetical protein